MFKLTYHKSTSVFCAIAVLATLAVYSAFTTQFTAYFFDYQAVLGQPIFAHFYWPWHGLIWSYHWYSIYPDIFNRVFALALIPTFMIMMVSLLLVKGVWGRRTQAAADLHGTARFANKKEVQKSGLLIDHGVYVGAYEDDKKKTHYLRHDGPEHIMAFAPTRSGKGVGLVLPTLLSWRESVVILDIKGENWALTAGWRQQYANNKVLKFDPASSDGDSVKFNPLEEIRLGTKHEVADVQNLVSMIVDPDGKGLNDHWSKTGSALLTGALIHLMYVAKENNEIPTLRGLAELLSDPEKPIEELFNEMLEYQHSSQGTHPVVASCARDMLNKAENERSGVHSTAMSFLTLYRDQIVAENTARSEFRVRDLMNHDQPVSLYLVIRPSDLDRLKPLVRLILNQLMRLLTEKMEFKGGRSVKGYKHRLLLLIDEFPALGRLEIFQQSLAFIAGYGMKAYLIIQDLAQLYSALALLPFDYHFDLVRFISILVDIKHGFIWKQLPLLQVF